MITGFDRVVAIKTYGHTYAVNCIAAGDDIKTAQENMGHATSSFTLDVYGYVFTQMRVRSAEHTEAHIQKAFA